MFSSWAMIAALPLPAGKLSSSKFTFSLCSVDKSVSYAEHWFVPLICLGGRAGKWGSWVAVHGVRHTFILPLGTWGFLDNTSSGVSLLSLGLSQEHSLRCVEKAAVTFSYPLFSEKLMFKNAPTPQEFKEGDDAVIVCDVVSSLPPTIIWKHKGRDVILKKDGKAQEMSWCLSIQWSNIHLPSGLKSGS